ncbi:hypothetical protein RI129_007458 [Pyrocoelia pectoralis]|uniref:CHK kinase-like domain-containing protein n=1 Tax=Pyrocoelia pectoralis TaxID=417401 RepID=A0AAN7ZLF7_9COLE
MEGEREANELEKLLECAIPPGNQMVDYSLNPLVKFGEDYGVVSINTEILTQNSGKETLEKVNVTIKACTKSGRIQRIFPNGLEIEILFYKNILPAMKQFVVDRGGCRLLDFFPKFHAARNSLKSDMFDEDAILLIENVEENGFRATSDFDFETTKNIIRDLAIFHAIPIAFKSINFDKFNAEIMSHLQHKRMFKNISQKSENELLDVAIKAAQLSPEGEDLLPRVVKSISGNVLYFSSDHLTTESEQFSTVIHNNLCLSSVVTKFENDVPVQSKFISFNMLEYGSLARDLVFVLLSSVNIDVLKESYFEFVTYYYNIFISVLMELNCDTHQFTLELLHEEINFVASKMEFFHLMVVTSHLYGQRKEVEPNEDDTEIDYFLQVEPNERCLQRIHEIILFFGKKCWI